MLYCFTISFDLIPLYILFFFFNDTATTEIYTLSLHDALPILLSPEMSGDRPLMALNYQLSFLVTIRSEEQTSELQSHHEIVCRLLIEKKKEIVKRYTKSDAKHCM